VKFCRFIFLHGQTDTHIRTRTPQKKQLLGSAVCIMAKGCRDIKQEEQLTQR